MARKPPRSPEQRLARWSRSMSPGTLNGKVASASPLAVDLTKLGPRQRALPPSSSFDPNEDPVIIGAGANIAGTATPSNPDPTYSGSGFVVIGTGANVAVVPSGGIAIGNQATVTGDLAIAIGGRDPNGPEAQGDGSIAIGADSTAWFQDDVAVGHFAQANGGGGGAVAIGNSSAGDNSVAILGTAHGQPSSGSVAIGGAALNPEGGVAVGYASNVSNASDRSIAIGAGTAVTGSGDNVVVGDHAADAGFTNVVVLGSASAATVDNQTVLGNLTTATFAETNQGYVVVDSVTSARQMITVASGVVTVVAAP